MKFRRISAISLAAALMATSTAIVADAAESIGGSVKLNLWVQENAGWTVSRSDVQTVSETGTYTFKLDGLSIPKDNLTVIGLKDADVQDEKASETSVSADITYKTTAFKVNGKDVPILDGYQTTLDKGVFDISWWNIWWENHVDLTGIDTIESVEITIEIDMKAAEETAADDTTAATEDTTADTTEDADVEADDEADDADEEDDFDEADDDDDDADDDFDDADDDAAAPYEADGVIDATDFGAQIYGMGTTNWSWATGDESKFDEDGALTLSADSADLNNKGDDTVQFGLQFYLGTDANGNGELAVGDSYKATVTYTLSGDNGVIKEDTVEISKTIEKNQWAAGIDGTYTLYSADIPKADLEGYGEVEATVEISDITYEKASDTASTSNDVAAAGDTAAATDSSKGSPDTGVEDVAAVAGLAVLAAGAVVVAKKRR